MSIPNTSQVVFVSLFGASLKTLTGSIGAHEFAGHAAAAVNLHAAKVQAEVSPRTLLKPES